MWSNKQRNLKNIKKKEEGRKMKRGEKRKRRKRRKRRKGEDVVEDSNKLYIGGLQMNK